jgi:hypothetical protein
LLPQSLNEFSIKDEGAETRRKRGMATDIP